MVIVGLLFFVVLTALSVSNAHAIIVLPALLLIPIAKLVAIVISGFIIPVAGISAFISSLRKKSFAQLFLFGIGILLVVGIVLAVILKLLHPDRPFL